MSCLHRSSGLATLRLLVRPQSLSIGRPLTPAGVNPSTNLQLCRPFFSSRFLKAGPPPNPRVNRARPAPVPVPSTTPAEAPSTSTSQGPAPQTLYKNAKIAVGSLIVSCVGVYIWQVDLLTQHQKHPSRKSAADLQWFEDNFINSLRNIRAGRYHTLLTSGFAHGGILHLGVNMFMLWSFGPGIILFYGLPRFLGCYFGSIISGGLLSNWYWARYPQKREQGSLGASGGLFGLTGAYAAWQPYASAQLFFIPMRMIVVAAIGGAVSIAGMMYPEEVLPGLGHSAHLGGLIFGAAFGMAVLRRTPHRVAFKRQ